MRTNYVLIDYENIPVKSLDLLQDSHFRLRVFLGPNNSKLPTELVVAIQRLGERADYIQLETSSPNALDFHIAYYLGRLALEDPTAFFHVISADKGFDPLLKHLKSKGIFAMRSASIEAMPCFKELPALQATIAASASNAGTNQPVNGLPVNAPSQSDAYINTAIVDLIRRRGAKPATVSKLINTIHSTLGKRKGVKLADAEDVYQQLQKRGYVKVKGDKVSYSLPESI
ncbi:PIN domain-containing protein [Pseudomonas panipatensis]|uniref:PIN-like domain-containing protein n=1 Tax=Pseudomonas panipatensis TaxID=428992 RepID=A0A1G8GN32_9PSED|nr:PIN domain-containing protein [Pseudomonas panipatensis]SDH95769.1 hypothetical protein SAMN05216272_104375 [Pseudomonas panipatensis]SMP42421.1 hypothetical protein SAMN06295951_101610 [Pseudomonas panipatensis]